MENIKILCDTDVIIEYLKGNEITKKTFDKLESANVVLSAITLMELYYGALNKKELNKIKKALSEFSILPLNEEITEITINLIEKYSKSHGLKIPDALIASTAIYYNISLWTYNIKDFHFIENLSLFKDN
ncbi:MAG: type II toxin-antitoxin system VapC family toxin [Thermoplasmata archaeon]|nr:MAG: type II toxin-antitoxin system VapC family toxin [Thermoplasmata archaeon]